MNEPQDTKERPVEEQGSWFVWGDGTSAILEDVSYDVMKKKVDELLAEGREDVYGENNEGGDTYP